MEFLTSALSIPERFAFYLTDAIESVVSIFPVFHSRAHLNNLVDLYVFFIRKFVALSFWNLKKKKLAKVLPL